ncbi:MAG: M3 family metallopeptidase, partial [Bacteroidales bacterium]|nr:M3 family metallopeptidase [Bacteroidales bacterium]
LSRVAGAFFNVNSAETNDEMQAVAQEVSPLLSDFSNDVSLNAALFARVKTVYAQKDQLGLTKEQTTLLEDTYQGFARSGANLEGADRERYREVSKRLSKLSLDFSENVLKATNAYKLTITDEADLAGMPDFVIEAAAFKAEQEEQEGWTFDLTMPSYLPLMQYASNRALREKVYIAYTSKAYGDEFDNSDNVNEIVNLRLERSQLLGYATYADYKLATKMAKNPTAVYALLDDLYQEAMPVARKEMEELQAYAKEQGLVGEFMPWDFSYYSEKLKEEKYSLNDELLKPYFELESVKGAVFGLATKLYGITFVKNNDIAVYHEEVEVFDVLNADGSYLSTLYTDFHPRKGKRGGAWMNNVKEQWKIDGVNSRPQVVIVMNFTRPTETLPALLTFNEVETFLHEFGHSLHGMLANTTYVSLSGTNVKHDFVELPSQLMENWAMEPEYLKSFAKHYETGEVIPDELIEKLKRAKHYHTAYRAVRQLSFCYLDMAWHTIDQAIVGDVKAFEEQAWAKTQLYDVKIPGVCMTTQFGHLFSGGYAAGYYSYKWAEVLDADAFQSFQEKGIYDQETAAAFRTLLEKGGSEDPMGFYVTF